MSKRRGNREGSIYRRGDGKWCASIVIGYHENGQMKRRTVYGKTKTEVQEKLKHLQSDSINGLLIEPNNVTVSDFLNRWIENIARVKLKYSTYVWYKSSLDNHINPGLGKIKLSALTPAIIQSFYSELEKNGSTAATIRRIHATLHRALELAYKWRLIAYNPSDVVEKPKAVKKKVEPLTTEQTVKFLAVSKQDRLHALYVLAITTGLRPWRT